MRSFTVIASEIPPAPVMGLTEDRWLVVVAVLALVLFSVGFLTGRRA